MLITQKALINKEILKKCVVPVAKLLLLHPKCASIAH